MKQKYVFKKLSLITSYADMEQIKQQDSIVHYDNQYIDIRHQSHCIKKIRVQKISRVFS